ncbi:MAG: sigma-54 dependent DNA-binding response regulator [Myxococcaceae bacterium]|nr:sigma-54 dependent DNA-binding response regulator [Myxococcaceae bacterium]
MRVLLVDDDAALSAILSDRLTARGYAVTLRGTAAAALEVTRDEDFDVVIADVDLPGMDGVELCKKVLELRPSLPVIMITALSSIAAAIGAIRAGAYDFLQKPFELEQLTLAIERGVTLTRLRDEVKRLHLAVADAHRFEELVGASPRMTELFALLAKVATSSAPVVITGESGTGKELVARALHQKSAHASGPFVAVNCAAMPAQLLEAELFGYARGAFTDAKSAKTGLFVAAHQGTLFLDEIGEIPLALQPKLLRALQEHKVRPLGDTREIPFDARILTATNRDLETMVEEQRFREDLFFRINVIQVPLPPLRSRGGDVLLLAQSFLERIAARADKRVRGFSPEAAQKLMAYGWPGNVRELQNCVERAVALATYETIAATDLPDKIRAFKSTRIVVDAEDPSELVSLDELERRYVTRVVEAVQGNKSAAARILQIERKTLYRMMERWGMSERKPE